VDVARWYMSFWWKKEIENKQSTASLGASLPNDDAFTTD